MCWAMASDSNSDRQQRSSKDMTLTAMGLTLLGVIISVGATVGFGISGAWWLRVAAGLGTSTTLVLVAAWATSSGRGGVARLANWVIGSER